MIEPIPQQLGSLGLLRKTSNISVLPEQPHNIEELRLDVGFAVFKQILTVSYN